MHIPNFIYTFVYLIEWCTWRFLIPFNDGANHFSLMDFWGYCAVGAVLWWFLMRLLGIGGNSFAHDIYDDIDGL